MKKIIYILFITFISTNIFAGAWTMPRGKIYTRTAFNYYYSNKNFSNEGSKKKMRFNGHFRDYNVSFYGEYGLTDSLTFITSLYYKNIRKEDKYIKATTTGIGDIDIALKYNIFKGKSGVLTVQGLIKIPEAYDKNDYLPLGNGQYDYELRLLYGQSLWGFIPGYFNIECGYRWRTESPADELRYLIEIGSNFGRKFYGRVKLDGILGMDNGKTETDALGNPTLSYNYDLGKLDITVGYKLNKKIGIELEYTPEIYGKNTSCGATYTFAITAVW